MLIIVPFSEIDLYSYTSPTFRLIQLFLCKLDIRYREHILTQLDPILLKSVIAEYMNSCVIIYLWFQITLFGNYPQKFIPWSSIILSAAQNHIYTGSVTSQPQSDVALSLQILFPHASADCWRQQSRCMWPATIRQYGLQHTVWDQIIPNDDGDQNFGGLLSVRYLCSRFW